MATKKDNETEPGVHPVLSSASEGLPFKATKEAFTRWLLSNFSGKGVEVIPCATFREVDEIGCQ
jgi:hypothetical protein